MKRARQPTLLIPAIDSWLKRNPVRLPTSQELRERLHKPKDEAAAARRFSETYRKLLPK
jgi:hypothetical protein